MLGLWAQCWGWGTFFIHEENRKIAFYEILMSSFTASMVTLLEVLKKVQVRVWGGLCSEDRYIKHFTVITLQFGGCAPRIRSRGQ